MLKPLYLPGQVRTEVVLDGPALRIARPACADLRVPLQRISRIVVSGGVNWATNALLACADNNVPIIFLRGNGSVRARGLGTQSRQSDLQQKWSYFIDRPDWQELYEDWRAPALRRSLALSARRLGMRADHCKTYLNELLTDPIRDSLGETAWSCFRTRLHGLAETKITTCLAKSGFQWSDSAGAALITDLSEVVAIGLLPELNEVIGGELATLLQRDNVAAMAEFFEQNGATVDFHLRLGLQSFCRFLEELD